MKNRCTNVYLCHVWKIVIINVLIWSKYTVPPLHGEIGQSLGLICPLTAFGSYACITKYLMFYEIYIDKFTFEVTLNLHTNS